MARGKDESQWLKVRAAAEVTYASFGGKLPAGVCDPYRKERKVDPMSPANLRRLTSIRRSMKGMCS